MYSLTSGTYLIHNFPSLACVSLPLVHTYFIFFLFSHVFSYLWHIPISSFFFFRMYSFASGTYLFHLFSFFACVPLPLAHTYFTFFLFSHVFLCLWHIPISSFFFFRMCSFASGTYLFHLFSFSACIPLPLAHTQSIISPSRTCIPLPLAHTYFTFFLFPHVFLCFWHIPNP